MVSRSSCILFLLILGLLPLTAQITPILPEDPDRELRPTDTIPAPLSEVRLSEDSLEAQVDYTAVDSIISDFRNQEIHLYGDAEVNYTNITLKAAYIVLNYETKIVTAEARRDSSGAWAGIPEFSEGDQTFSAQRMRYNFETKKGIVYDVTSSYNDVVVKGNRTKFVSGEEPVPVEPGDTSSAANDILYSQNAIFTTCTAPEPHFGIRSRKQKVIPEKLVVVGPSNLEIMGVPTPLWLPFGFFPIASGRRSGLLFPRDYEYSRQWGFGVRDLGWFFPLGEHFNLSLTTNLYVKGTWGLNAYSQYRKRYKYSGSFRLGYDSRRSEDNEGNVSRTNSFAVNWTHSQDRAAHPSNRFGGSINFQLNNYASNVYNDPNNVLPTQLNSNFSFDKNWIDKPISLSVAFNHSQNTATNDITINFPTVKFQTQSLYPFKRKNRGGNREAWYETFVLRYQGEARNRFEATDSTLFSQKTIDDALFGVKHDVNAGLSFKLFRYFNLNPGVTYEEVWYTKSTNVDFIEDPIYEVDTLYNADSTAFTVDSILLSGGFLDTSLVRGFQTYRTYNVGVALNTQIFGTLRFRNGPLRGLRHVIKPSFSFSFSPDYLDPDKGYYYYLPRNPENPQDSSLFSIFDNTIFGPPPRSQEQMALSYSFNNIFEAKVWSKKDSTDRNIKLIDNLVIGGSYNFAADTLKWSQVSMRGTTRFFKGATTISYGALFDPYIADKNGRRIDRFAWKENGQPLRFVQASLRVTTNLTVSKLRALFQGREEEVVEDIRDNSGRGRPERLDDREEDDLLSLLDNFRISHNLTMNWNGKASNRAPFEVTTNSLSVQGNIKLTQNWSINLGSIGYDFKRKQLTYPYVGFSRDLHCWDMGLNWAPNRGTYSFFIRVKPGSMDFLKLPYEQNNADAIRAF